jgi:hypothetical protein
MSPQARREYLATIRPRYLQAARGAKARLLDEVCAATGYHRKYAIQLLAHPPASRRPRRRRSARYLSRTIDVLSAIWEAAGYPWSVRLTALVPLWLPWAQRRFRIPPPVTRQLLAISPRTIDRRLQVRKRQHRRRLYGRTKPGTLLKHHIPIKTTHWDVTTPGFGEADLVAHSGPAADGEFLHTLTLTDIHSTWVENRALFKHPPAVVAAVDELTQVLPFPLQGLDADNGAEFINHQLWQYCQQRRIHLTRGRPYKKDDNAHVEQKNWTHVRKLIGWDRYDTRAAQDALNDLYRHELRWMMNLFQPSVKLVRKVRVGARLRRVYDRPQTPLDRLLATPRLDQARLAPYVTLRARLDPFALAQTIDRKLVRIYQLASRSPRPQPAKHGTPPPRPTSAADRIMHQEWRRRMDQALVTATGSPVRNCVAR